MGGGRQKNPPRRRMEDPLFLGVVAQSLLIVHIHNRFDLLDDVRSFVRETEREKERKKLEENQDSTSVVSFSRWIYRPFLGEKKVKAGLLIVALCPECLKCSSHAQIVARRKAPIFDVLPVKLLYTAAARLVQKRET